MGYKGIIFCATQRSGSTMIVDLFEKLGYGIGREHFISPIRKRRNDQEIDWDKSIKRIVRKSRANGYSSIKIMANYLHHIEHFCSNGEKAGTEDTSFPHVYERFQDYKWVWIIRRNLVRQALSRYVARKTKIYHSTHLSDTMVFEELDMKKEELDKIIQKIAYENSLWQNFFDQNKVNYTTIYYEDLKRDSDYLENILRTSNIDYPLEGYGTVDNVKSEYKKLKTISTDQIYKNYLDYMHNRLKVK